MIFAHLTISQPAVLLEFLSSMNLEGKNGLALVLEAWCDFFTDFQGFYSIKVRYHFIVDYERPLK